MPRCRTLPAPTGRAGRRQFRDSLFKEATTSRLSARTGTTLSAHGPPVGRTLILISTFEVRTRASRLGLMAWTFEDDVTAGAFPLPRQVRTGADCEELGVKTSLILWEESPA